MERVHLDKCRYEKSLKPASILGFEASLVELLSRFELETSSLPRKYRIQYSSHLSGFFRVLTTCVTTSIQKQI